MTPRVSVIMAAYNAADTITESVESILGQTFGDWELVIVDDASTDRTAEFLAPFANHPRITIHTNKINQGGAASRMLAISKAHGQLLAIQDADDISLPDRLETQIQVFDAHPDTDVVGGQMLDFGDWGGPHNSYCWPTEPQDIRRRLVKGANPLADPTAIFRRVAYQTSGGYDKSLRRVYDLGLYLRMKEMTFRAVRQPVLLYRTKRPLPLSYCIQEGRFRHLALQKYLHNNETADLPRGIRLVLVDARSLISWARRSSRELQSGS